LERELARRFRFDVAGLYLYSQATGAFSPVSDVLVDPASVGYQVGQLPAAGTMKEAAVRAGAALLCDDMGASAWTEGPLVSKAGFVSAVVAPLVLATGTEGRGGPRTIAVMFMGAKTCAAFTEDDRALVEMLAARIAPVLQTVLAAEERDALMAINSRVVVGTVTVESLMPAIEETIQKVIPHDITCLVRFTIGPEGPWFEPVHFGGFEFDFAPLRRFPFERTAPAEMLATGRPVLITGHDRERFAEAQYIESVGILSGMLCPLNVRGTPYGFLAIGSRRRNAFSARDLVLAEQVGHHLSLAISNILAYEEIRSLKDQLERENVYLKEEIGASIDFKELVGESPSLQKTLRAIEKVAATDTTVLVAGETGTGKELVALAIHQLSPRKDKPLIKVNCAALPPSLIESELFGHEKGAFSGATARRIGRFELADQGTIFLDEVGEIPLDIQVKLLRVLEAHELERVGGSQTIRLNVRVIAATNTDLQQAVKAGTFRNDLYYRLKVFPIRVPPLRERREDIPMLARHFVKKYAARYRKDVTRIGTAALQALDTYAWPGNVRELEHVIERAVILARGSVLTIEELEGDTATDSSHKPSYGQKTLAEVERVHIEEVLKQTNWVIAGRRGAAARLSMKRSTLQHRMKKLGIKRPPGT
jgi:formate hydrogenlyase transcriptional activator